MMTSSAIRKTFLDYFASKGHRIVASAPMVIHNDPTLLFVNAGMNPFKDIFIGNSPIGSPRVADSQKCLRVSGKHNDLEEVGHDTYHHTLFEMLGNWSFGDYFKREAIAYAWELLTEVYQIPKDYLYITVFGGDEKDGTSKDLEAYDLWKSIVPEDRILFGNKKDNFWEMGESGPCGPCSEIHVDIRSAEEKAKISGREMVNQDHPQVIEIWNLVFMQYNRMANGSLVELPSKHVDTGMGFERLCMVVQGKTSNYDTDIFQPLIQHLAAMAGRAYGLEEKTDIALRVISDHLRAVSFAIADGQLPSNNKAGYVIRRILRRAVRYGYTFLDFREPFICKMVEVLVREMGDFYPELKKQQSLITKVIAEEETSFLRTLESGIKLLDQIMLQAHTMGKKEISGKDAFTAYDTYGFPFDLTDLILRENHFTVDYAEFEQELGRQKARSRQAASVDTDDWVELQQGDSTVFVGYDQLRCDVQLVRYRKVSTKNKTYYQLVLDRTPFYAESGGQVGDKGYLEDGKGQRTLITDTKKENNLIIHLCDKLPQDPSEGFTAQVDEASRLSVVRNHSATHLMHYALREVLGTHVEQKGSLVRPDGLRFDFSHFQKMTDEEIRRVEVLVNEMIRSCTPLDEQRDLPIGEAQHMGAMALFGEKYGDRVRVIRFGSSVELCGGTHAENTGSLGIFRIVSESAIAAGVRRIEAVTGVVAENMFYSFSDSLKELQNLFKAPNLIQAVEKVIQDNDLLKKQVGDFVQERKNALLKLLLSNAIDCNGYKLIELHDNVPAEIIKSLAFDLKKELSSVVFIASTVQEGKVSLTLALGEEVVQGGHNASQIIREVAPLLGGSGGGQAFMATAGGSKADQIHATSMAIKKMLGLD